MRKIVQWSDINFLKPELWVARADCVSGNYITEKGVVLKSEVGDHMEKMDTERVIQVYKNDVKVSRAKNGNQEWGGKKEGGWWWDSYFM